MSAYSTWASGINDWALTSYGKPIVFRRMTTISGAQNPVSGTITVATAAVIGASTITLTAPQGNWFLAAGDTFTVAGDPTVYTIEANVTAASAKFTGVSISPPLAANASIGAAVSFVWQADYPTFGRVSQYSPHMLVNSTIGVRDIKLLMQVVDTSGRPIPQPRPLDLVSVDGAFRAIGIAPEIYAAEAPVLYEVQVKG